MNLLGFRPTKNSGSGWVEKEDGQNENAICQLKSTDAQSIKICKKDLDTLLINAAVCHKIPVFAVQFLQSQEVYLVVKPELIADIAKYIKTGEYTPQHDVFAGVDLSELEDTTVYIDSDKVVRSSSSARERFAKQNAKKFEKEKRSAK